MSNVITNTFINAVNNIGVPIDEIEILAHGKMNAIIRAGNKCYRIWYKDISKQLIEDKRKEYKTIKQHKDIFIVPNKLVCSDEYLYWEIKYVQHYKETSYDHIKNFFKGLLQLTKDGYVWTDYKRANVTTDNKGVIKIVDFDLTPIEDIPDIINDVGNIPMKDLKKLTDKPLTDYVLFCAINSIANIKGIHTGYKYQKLFNDVYLYQAKNGITNNMMTKELMNKLLT